MPNKEILYHYKPLTEEKHFEHLENYMQQKIWLTRLDNFNDPFEGQFIYQSFSSKEIIQKINKDFFSSYGAICLTSYSSNIPMWAHYASNHRGYCVVFEFDLNFIYEKYKKEYESQGEPEYTRAEFDEYIKKVFYPEPSDNTQEILSFHQLADDVKKKFIFMKVLYEENLPIIKEEKLLHDHNEYTRNKYIAKNSFGVKFKQWQYENEYRLLVNANSCICGLMDLRAYPFIKVICIILGENLNKETIGHVSSLSKKYDINLRFTRCSDEQYKILDVPSPN